MVATNDVALISLMEIQSAPTDAQPDNEQNKL